MSIDHIAALFEKAVIAEGLRIRRRFPSPFGGYEYRLSLPGEPDDGHWYIDYIDFRLYRPEVLQLKARAIAGLLRGARDAKP